MKHMTSYVFNDAYIKTIDDAVVRINNAQTRCLLSLVTRTSRKGTTATFSIKKSVPSMPGRHYFLRYKVTNLKDILRIVCNDIHLLVACIDANIIVPF